jgi:hypothetical protein
VSRRPTVIGRLLCQGRAVDAIVIDRALWPRLIGCARIEVLPIASGRSGRMSCKGLGAIKESLFHGK